MHMMRNIIQLTIVLFAGCAPSGPKSANEKSTARPQLSERVAFIEQYVKFRRSYKSLEYDVEYHNNGGVVLSGPSEWDIKILAAIPPKEIYDWLPAAITPVQKPVPKWVTALPGNIATSGITEWYIDGKRLIGVDRENAIIVYRNDSMPSSNWDE